MGLVEGGEDELRNKAIGDIYIYMWLGGLGRENCF